MEEILFNNFDRDQKIQKAEAVHYDMIVIGGGITGAGILLDATLRGMNVLLLEQRDFASGTSSKSTKLIHGGLRYLKQLEFGLVRETGMERAIVHGNVPHLVHPETMILPIVEGGTFNSITASMAISVYDFLANVEKKDRKKSLNKEQVEKEEPLINSDLLKSGIAYSEYRTDDARLTIELIKAARREGAEAFNYVKVNDFIYENDKVIGVKCKIKGSPKKKINFHARHIVSAAGPWVDKLRILDKSKKGKSLHLTKGVHIVVPKERLNINKAVYFDAFDNRMLFAIPRGKITYIGTSDTTYNHSLNRVLCTQEDVQYILEKTNHMFPSVKLTNQDVISSWAGLRPLIHEDGKSPSDLSRKDEIFISKKGLISIAGGKLTGYRKMAKRVVNKVLKLDDVHESCKTKTYKIHADSFLSYTEYLKYLKQLKKEYSDKGISKYTLWYLITNYGKTGKHILDLAIKMNGDFEENLIKSEIQFAIQYESCFSPADYFIRRSGRLYFDVQSVHKHFELIISEFADQFQWNEEYTVKMREKSRKNIEDVTVFGTQEANSDSNE